MTLTFCHYLFILLDSREYWLVDFCVYGSLYLAKERRNIKSKHKTLIISARRLWHALRKFLNFIIHQTCHLNAAHHLPC